MLSSDKNVETIAHLIEVLREYVELQKEYLKFDVVEKLVRLVAAMTLGVIILVITIAMMIYLSFAVVYWIAPHTGIANAYAIVAAFFLAILVLVTCFRKAWIERPLVRCLAAILLDEEQASSSNSK